MNITIEIEGKTPILFNRFTDANEVSVSSGTSPSMRGDSKGTPREQAQRTCYVDDKGMLYLPAPNVFSCLIEAGKFHKVGKNKVTTQKSSLVPAGIFMNEIVLSFNTKSFEVDSRRVVIPATGGAIMRHRGRLDQWRLKFSLEVDTSMFSPKFVRELVDDAGKKIGLGDYRPSRKGPFGRFVVVNWTEEK